MGKIHPLANVDKGAQLGDDVEIGPYCIVGAQVKLGARTRLQSHVNVEGLTEIGEDCVVHPFASLGGPPQHAAHKGNDTSLIIGDRNLIRESVTMNAGSSVGAGVIACAGAGVGGPRRRASLRFGPPPARTIFPASSIATAFQVVPKVESCGANSGSTVPSAS